jgi:hypothetical protein
MPPQRLQPDLDVLQHREPGEQRKGLEHHRHFGCWALDAAAGNPDLATARRHEAGDDAQQGGLAAARAAEQRDDLVAGEGEVDVVEHEHIVAAALGIVLADTVDLEQRRRSDLDSRRFHNGLLYSRRKRRSASR